MFSVACLTIFSYLAMSLFYTIPSNALSSRHSKGARAYFNTVTPQVWAFFTKNPEGTQIGFYSREAGVAHNLLRTPQGNPSNLFGLDRTQRAQGPEIAYLNAGVTSWEDCAGLLDSCLDDAAARTAQKVENHSPVRTICGDSYITQEETVPWSYRNLVKYEKRVVRIAHLDVICA
ncbi:SdpA family antimicrobial peptide system protein [Kitasatospora atroaurantiaca]